MIKFENHIIFDSIESWPNAMKNLIRKNEDSLKGFFKEEHRIDKLARENVELRFFRPKNIYLEKWDLIISEIETILKQHSIIGIHCSKLFDWEIKDIESNGLKPLDRDFANKRIEKAVKKGALSKDLGKKLIDKKEFSEPNRKGYVWVFHCLETLTDESGLNRLLGLWGGESLYANIKDNEELKTIGTPCIVFTSIKIRELDIYPDLSKRMTAFYFDDNYFPHDADSIIKTDLNVLRVVKHDEKIFEELTGIENWDNEGY
ncbi:MAG TPA: hypothetical protein PKD18_01820 [Saprospiraceae bacterium]|nr:hypothetical protein [Saprospiraceae bacterium]